MRHGGLCLICALVAASLLAESTERVENVSIFDKKALPVNVIWSHSTSAYIRSSPAVDETGIVYIGSGMKLYALEGGSGELCWTFQAFNLVYGSPAVVTSLSAVYVGANDNRLYGVNIHTGTLLWSYLTTGPITGTPAVRDNIVYIGSHDGTFYALYAAPLTQRWVYATGGPIVAGAFVDEATVYFGSNDGKLYALNSATGALRWSFDAGSDIQTRPVKGPAGRLYFGCIDGFVYALDASNGAQIWTFDTNSTVTSSPSVDSSNTVYFGDDSGAVYALYSDSGAVKWVFNTAGPVHSSARLNGNTLYIGSLDNLVYALYMNNGTRKWSYNSYGDVYATPALISPTSIVIGTGIGNIVALRDGYSEKSSGDSSQSLLDSSIITTVAVAAGCFVVIGCAICYWQSRKYFSKPKIAHRYEDEHQRPSLTKVVIVHAKVPTPLAVDDSLL